MNVIQRIVLTLADGRQIDAYVRVPLTLNDLITDITLHPVMPLPPEFEWVTVDGTTGCETVIVKGGNDADT